MPNVLRHFVPVRGTYPLNAAVLGGAQLYEGDAYIVSLLTAERVGEVAQAVTEVERAAFEEGYRRIDVRDYGPNFGDEDLAYSWASFLELVDFFRRAADAGSCVIFTVGQ